MNLKFLGYKNILVLDNYFKNQDLSTKLIPKFI